MNRRTFLVSSTLAALHTSASSAFAKTLPAPSTPPENPLRDKLMHDNLRPQFHLLPPAGFLGDPCAPRYYQGNYHAFFHGSFGGRGWHHAMSPDLLHWKQMPIALTPTAGSPDEYGTFTGSVLPGDPASIIYTGVTKVPTERETIRNEGLREVQCIATTNDPDLATWHKLDKAVIDGPPPGLKITGFRDPFSWKETGKEGDTWYIGVGSGFPQLGGAVLLYRSHDARTWEYLHPLAQGTWNGEYYSNPVPSGEMWECPDFFPLGDKHVLIFSSEKTTFWQVGTFDREGLRFIAERGGLLDNGAYYAPKSMLDNKNRRILWAWVQETRPGDEIKAAGWGGSMSLPRVLTLDENHDLQMGVAAELTTLRTNTVHLNQPQDDDAIDSALTHAVIQNRAGEILWTFQAGDTPCGLDLHLGSAIDAPLLVSLKYALMSGRPALTIGDKTLQLKLASDGNCTVHLWIDGSILEAFVDRKQSVTIRSYVAPDQTEIHTTWTGPANLLKNLTISTIQPISNDRLTS